MHVYVVCLTILLCVFMVCKLKINIGITVKHEYEHDTVEPTEDDSEEYETIEENTISTDEILNAFNDLFGGIDDE